ncbi:MAG TPA: polysaccharide deacetylase family protein, partial [Novosphingobium sp.]|nr:polysaccharide deacetylase family protein [Novosphingobium sp.]
MFSPSPSRPPLPRAQARRRAITGLRPALGALLALLCAAAPSQGLAAPARPQASDNHAGEIALTFDDLPAISLVRRQSYVEDLNRRLLAGLRRHRIPATGFVNEGKLDEMNRRRQTAVLRQWLAAGMELGNHTYSHENPSDLGADGYIADIAQGEKVTRPMMAAAGRQLHWFRPPNLELGHPEPVRRQIADWLDAHGYAIA